MVFKFLKDMDRMAADGDEPNLPIHSSWWDQLDVSSKAALTGYVLSVLWAEGVITKSRPLGMLQKKGFTARDVLSIESAGFHGVMNSVVFTKEEGEAKELFTRAAEELGCAFQETPDGGVWEKLTEGQRLVAFTNAIYLMREIFAYFDKFLRR